MIGAVAAFLCAAPVSHAGVEFAGVYNSSEGTYFTLSDNDTKEGSEWIQIGESFAGCRIQAFDAGTDTLQVVRDGRLLSLPLRAPKTGKASPVQIIFPQEKIIAHMTKRFAGSRVVIRAIAQIRDGRELFTCTEVWKADDGAPHVGDVLKGSVVTQEWGGDNRPYEAIMFFESFPPGKDIPHGGYPQLVRGKFPWCPDLDPDELRTILTAAKG